MTEEEMAANLNFIADNLCVVEQKTLIKDKIVQFQNCLYQNISVELQSVVRNIWNNTFLGFRLGRKKAKSKVGDSNWFHDLKNCMIENEFFLDCQFNNNFALLTKFMHKPNYIAITIIHSLQKNNALEYVVQATNNYKTFTNLVKKLYLEFKTQNDPKLRKMSEYIRLAQTANAEIKDPNHKFLTEELINDCLLLMQQKAADNDGDSVKTDTDSIIQFMYIKRVSSPDLLNFLSKKRHKLTNQ